MLLNSAHQKWEADYRLLKAMIDPILAGINYQIEHVGSTAIPGLLAKDIVDLDIQLLAPDDFLKVKSKLEEIGYLHTGDQGIRLREVFKRQGEVVPVLDHIRHHLYVCRFGCQEFSNHIQFRDYLRSHAEVRNTYQEMKQQLAAQAKQDKKKYALLKSEKMNEFFQEVLKKANEEI